MYFIPCDIKQTLNMGVSYTDNCSICPVTKVKKENISERNVRSIYRSDEIYKECSYQLPAINSWRPKKKLSSALDTPKVNKELPQYNERLDAQYYLSHLPVVERQCKHIKDLPETSQKLSDYTTDHFESHQVDVDTNAQASHIISTDNVGTSVASFLKYRQSVKIKVKTWYKNTFPKFACPCCTGGSDAGAPYHSQSAAGSYESIDLKACSNNAFHSLDLDASLMSIIHLHRSLRLKKTPKVYAKLLGGVMCNIYKNAIDIISSIKL